MLRLRDEHLHAFRQSSREDFERRAIARIRFDWPEPTAAMTDGEIKRRLTDLEPRSQKYGLRTELEIVQYVESSILLGDGFEDQPEHQWARNVLASERIGPAEKGRLIEWTAGHIYRDQQSGNEPPT